MADGSMAEVEAGGVAVAVDRANLEDARFVLALGKVSDESVEPREKLVWYSRMLDVLFGGRAYQVMCDLSEASGGGPVSPDAFSEFYGELMEKVGAKN